MQPHCGRTYNPDTQGCQTPERALLPPSLAQAWARSRCGSACNRDMDYSPVNGLTGANAIAKPVLYTLQPSLHISPGLASYSL